MNMLIYPVGFLVVIIFVYFMLRDTDRWLENHGISGKHCDHPIMGDCSLKCPWCGVYGFYSPKETPNNVMRTCKWCGYWQKSMGEPYKCHILACLDQECRSGTFTENNLKKPCDICGGPTKEIKWPTEDPDHSFWNLKAKIYKEHGYE